jgi:hypothetical protein
MASRSQLPSSSIPPTKNRAEMEEPNLACGFTRTSVIVILLILLSIASLEQFDEFALGTYSHTNCDKAPAEAQVEAASSRDVVSVPQVRSTENTSATIVSSSSETLPPPAPPSQTGASQKERFLLIDTSNSGFSNQQECLRLALVVARDRNLTAVMSEIAVRPNHFYSKPIRTEDIYNVSKIRKLLRVQFNVPEGCKRTTPDQKDYQNMKV